MREFIYYSEKARTSGNFKDLMKAGRMDIVCHVVIASFFLSHKLRDDVKLHLVFNGPPDAPKHLELVSNLEMQEFISKKDIAGLIKRMLYKCKKGKKTQVFPGCFIEKKSFGKLVNELSEQGKRIFLLDARGDDIRETDISNAVFVFGDHDGLPKKERKELKTIAQMISLGNETYFTSQAVVILHNELDRMM